MKKVSLLILLFALAHFIYADDIIYLNNGDEIKSKILKISSNVIEYKKSSNLNGPAYEIAKDEVVMIIYENGEKDMFITKAKSTDNASEKVVITKEPISNDTISINNIPNKFGIVLYDGDKLISYNGEKIKSNEYKEIARKNCYKAYEQYKNGQSYKIAGGVLMGVGVPLTAVGILCAILTEGTASSIALTVSSAGLTLAGIPLYCVGKSKTEQSYEIFNNSSQGYISSSELQFRINNDGMGLALVF